MYQHNWKCYVEKPQARNDCLFPFRTQTSPHCTIRLSLGKIHAHIWNGLVQVQNTFLDVLMVYVWIHLIWSGLCWLKNLWRGQHYNHFDTEISKKTCTKPWAAERNARPIQDTSSAFYPWQKLHVSQLWVILPGMVRWLLNTIII